MSKMLTLNLKGIIEPQLYAENQEVKLRVKSAEVETNSSGNPMVKLIFDDPLDRTRANVYHNINLATVDTTPEKREFMMLQIKRAFLAFGLPDDFDDTLDLSRIEGKEFWAKIGLDEYQGITRNKIVKFIKSA